MVNIVAVKPPAEMMPAAPGVLSLVLYPGRASTLQDGPTVFEAFGERVELPRSVERH
jgi:hypothetical protein